MNLFERKSFTSHSGLELLWKIECDALTEESIETFAAIINRNFVPFCRVVGVPHGRTRIATALEKYKAEADPTLIVDDVLTTGRSMEDCKRRIGPYHTVLGVVLFARDTPPYWVTPIFQLTEGIK